jgi:hypothetical protein
MRSNQSYLEYLLQSGFTNVGLMVYFIAKGLAVRNVLVRKRRSKVGEYPTKRALVDKLKSLKIKYDLATPNQS